MVLSPPKGSHKLKATLDELRSYIYELNTENCQNLNIQKIEKFLDVVRDKKVSSLMWCETKR